MVHDKVRGPYTSPFAVGSGSTVNIRTHCLSFSAYLFYDLFDVSIYRDTSLVLPLYSLEYHSDPRKTLRHEVCLKVRTPEERNYRTSGDDKENDRKKIRVEKTH